MRFYPLFKFLAPEERLFVISQERRGYVLNYQSDFEPHPKRLEALRNLESLFNPDNLHHHNTTSLRELKTWRTVYNFDLEKIKDLLGNKESEKLTIDDLQN